MPKIIKKKKRVVKNKIESDKVKKLPSRKDKLKKAFIKLLNEQNGKFDKDFYMNNSCKGKLRDEMDEHDDRDRKLFNEILEELTGIELYHIGGHMYKRLVKGK